MCCFLTDLKKTVVIADKVLGFPSIASLKSCFFEKISKNHQHFLTKHINSVQYENWIFMIFSTFYTIKMGSPTRQLPILMVDFCKAAPYAFESIWCLRRKGTQNPGTGSVHFGACTVLVTSETLSQRKKFKRENCTRFNFYIVKVGDGGNLIIDTFSVAT